MPRPGGKNRTNLCLHDELVKLFNPPLRQISHSEARLWKPAHLGRCGRQNANGHPRGDFMDKKTTGMDTLVSFQQLQTMALNECSVTKP